MSLLSFKKVTLPTKFNSGLPAGLVSELFFCGKITTNQKPFSSLLELNPIFPANRSWALRSIWGRKPSIPVCIFYKEQHCCAPGDGNRAATKPGFFLFCGVLCTPVGEDVEAAACPLQNISNRALVPNQPWHPCAATTLTHLCTGKATLWVCFVGLFPAKIWGWAPGPEELMHLLLNRTGLWSWNLTFYSAWLKDSDFSERRAGAESLWGERALPWHCEIPTLSAVQSLILLKADLNWLSAINVYPRKLGQPIHHKCQAVTWECSPRSPALPSQPWEGKQALSKHFQHVSMPMSFQGCVFVPAALILN